MADSSETSARPTTSESGSKLRALHTLRDGRLQFCLSNHHSTTPSLHHFGYGTSTCLRYRYMIGALNSKLSSKSNMPPMPGKNLPESLTPASRLKSDSIKSPI